MKPNLTILTKTTGWYGAHSGFYEQVSRRLAEPPTRAKIIHPKDSFTQRVFGKIFSLRLGVAQRNQNESAAEMRFLLAALRSRRTSNAILNMDDHWPLLRLWKKAPRNLVGFIHIPTSQWEESCKNDCRRLSSAIVLWRREIAKMESLIGNDRVRFVPHGIDTAFFRPSEYDREHGHFLMCGQYLRDFGALRETWNLLKKRHSTLKLTMVIPPQAIMQHELGWAANDTSVSIRSGLSDEELLLLYQRCSGLLMPLLDSGANNAILEALACGTPIITNDIGGIRDYGGGTAFPLASNVRELADIADRHIQDSSWNRNVSLQQRQIAIDFDWEHVIPKLISAVRELSQ